MVDEDDNGDFHEFASLLKAHPGRRYGHKFHQRHNLGSVRSFNRQRGHGRGFFNRQNGSSRDSDPSYEGDRQDFCQIRNGEGFRHVSNVEEANNSLNNVDPQHHYNNEGFVHMRNSQFPSERNHWYGHGQQNPKFSSNRLLGRGRWKSNYHSRGCIGNHGYGRGYYRHGVSDYEDAQKSQCFGNNVKPHFKYSGKQGKSKIFVDSHDKMVGRGGAFRGSFKRMVTNFDNKTLTQCVNSDKDTANASSSADLHVNMHDDCKGDGVDPKTCTKESLPSTKIDGSAPSTRKKVQKQKVSSLIQGPFDAKCASKSLAPFISELENEGTLLQGEDVTIDIDKKHQETNPEKEGTYLLEEDVTINIEQHLQESKSKKGGSLPQEGDAPIDVNQRHRGRAFISCMGGSNTKRQRSAAVRDFPVGCGNLRFSTVKKAKTTAKLSRATVRDVVVANSIGEVGSPANLEVMNENSGNLGMTDVRMKFVQVDPKDSFRGCSRTHVTKRDDSELVPSDGELALENASKTVVDEGGTFVELVQPSPEADKSKTTVSKEGGHADLIQASLEVNCENHSKPIIKDGLLEPVQVGFEGNIWDHTKTNEKDGLLEPVQAGSEDNSRDQTKANEMDKDYFTQLVQSVSQVSKQECNAKVETAGQISCNGHLAFASSLMKMPPQIRAVATSMDIHTSSQGISHSIVKNKKKKTSVNQKAETQSSDGPLKRKRCQIKLDMLATEPTDISTGLHNQGDLSKKPKAPDFSKITDCSGELVPYQNSRNGIMKNKDSERRLLHKGSTRLKYFQTSKSLDSPMHSDPTKGLSVEATEGVSARSLVKRTLHEFESIRKALVKSQDPVRRADLDAASLLKERGKWRNCDEKIVGEVPGVEVGDQFSFRMEMLIIGLHRQVQSGIDYIPGTKRNNGAPLATSIVASGGYEDDKDDGNTLIYSGQGGNNNKGNKKQESNQVLVRGNLAMSNSMKEGTPVRVIRGITDLTSPSSRIYTYDGLYDVIDLRFECGATGYGVYHFTLTRRAGQPQVGLSFLSNLKKKGLARPYILLDDISRGQERLPVCVVNEVDEETAPLSFTYIPKIKHPVWYSPLLPQGCNCIGVCDEETCSCAIKNGNELPYNEKGYIIRDKTVVYECGISCSCSSFCQNRVSQKGLRYRLEIFKTKNRGWGVRSLDPIQPGGFICEYTGELLTDAEAEQKVENDEYLFDLGKDGSSCDQLDLAKSDGSTAIVPGAEDVAYTIDAKDLGNVARFINHSCSPNLYAQNVLYDSDDVRFPHVMLFAMENIPPMRELTYDYNYTLDQVRDAYGNVKTKACYCGAQDCQGRLY